VRTSLLSIFAITICTGLTVSAKDKPEPPRACIFSPSKEASVCVSGLRWIMFGPYYGLQRISGVFENNSAVPVSSVQLTFSIFDADDVVVQSATAIVNATIPAGSKATFSAVVDEPESTGIHRVTLYTNQVRLGIVNMAQAEATVDLKIPILFTTGNALGVRKYKKIHGLP
jgi:hypothetical protein